MKLPWEAVIDGVVSTIDNLHTSDKEKWELALKQQALDQRGDELQVQVNIEQAKHPSIFVAGPRPAAMWVCVFGLAWQFVFHPFMLWLWSYGQSQTWIPAGSAPPPAMDISMLMGLLGGMLGLSGYRTYEKKQGVDTKRVQPRETS